MKAFFAVLSAALIFLSCGCERAPLEKTDFMLDTLINIKIYDTNDSQILDGVFGLIADYEKMLSKTIEGSDVYKINHAGGTPVSVSAETAELLAKAGEYYELSGGLFDVTVAPVTALWDFHSESPRPPEDTEIQNVLSHVGFDKIKINGLQVTLADDRAAIDLGAVAKGYIGDRAAQYLRENGIKRALLNLGGNIVLIGGKTDRSDWRVGIQDPEGQAGDYAASVGARDTSFVTSGIYERSFSYGGKKYHHIIDPATGYPRESDLLSATVIYPVSADADALSTVCILVGREKAAKLIEDYGAKAVFIDIDGNISAAGGVIPE